MSSRTPLTNDLTNAQSGLKMTSHLKDGLSTDLEKKKAALSEQTSQFETVKAESNILQSQLDTAKQQVIDKDQEIHDTKEENSDHQDHLTATINFYYLTVREMETEYDSTIFYLENERKEWHAKVLSLEVQASKAEGFQGHLNK